MEGGCEHIVELSWAHVGYRLAKWLNFGIFAVSDAMQDSEAHGTRKD